MINAPNLSYPCESCGTLIRENHICDTCRKRFEKDKNQMFEDLAKQRERQESQSAAAVYKGLDRYKDK